MNPNLIKKINEIFHEIESKDYDERHPEIMIGQVDYWKRISNIYIKTSANKRRILIDIATGTGFVPSLLINNLNSHDKIIGYDISLNMLKQAKSKMNYNNFYPIKGDAENLPLKNKSVDILTINTALHHFPDISKSVREMDRIIKCGGLLIIGREPNNSFFKSPIIKISSKIYVLLWGVKIDNKTRDDINRRLKDIGLITKNLSKKDIVRNVEYNSISEDKFLKASDENFTPENIIKLLNNYEVLERSTMSTFIYRSRFPLKNILNKIINKMNNNGSMFSLVLKKK